MKKSSSDVCLLLFVDASTEYSRLVVRRIRESGNEDSNLFANFAGEREDSNPKAKDSNLCCQVKSTQNCLKSSKIGQLLAYLCAGNYQPKMYAI
jgi:hypothetical protein